MSSIYLPKDSKDELALCMKWLSRSNATGLARKSKSAVLQMCLRAAGIVRAKGYTPDEFIAALEKLPARR